jgi:hypothetical protein
MIIFLAYRINFDIWRMMVRLLCGSRCEGKEGKMVL